MQWEQYLPEPPAARGVAPAERPVFTTDPGPQPTAPLRLPSVGVAHRGGSVYHGPVAGRRRTQPEASRYEQLGAFFLGEVVDASGERTGEPFLYDARDLTTHAVCVGMTGSGKTGLCVSLLEEAAIDGIPSIAIDPKGDLANLLLTFPDLRPDDFLPWVDESEALREGQSREQYARTVAERWKRGLADWGQDGARIRRFEQSVERAIYTPGSRAGRPLRVLRSLEAPAPALRGDADALAERTQATVSGLLTLLGIDPDPIRSREHILLSKLVQGAWAAGRSLDLAALIREIQSPSFPRVGVFDLESFFPASERQGLAMTLNNLLASPGFAAWMEGEPLDVQRLLTTSEGRPRLSVLSIAHLSESERMFFVTLLLNEVVAWMRSQPGTQSLRAILYMDEVFGYFPPTANPPSKRPMLTLLKQARAYGLGCVLATQNPVDLDYKGLSNTGTWILGRLQTERDKARVMEGLEGVSATTGARFDRARTERQLAGLGNRVFLVNDVHEDGPVLMQTRWALSYLHGPLTREQIARLSPRPEGAEATEAQPPASPVAEGAPASAPADARLAAAGATATGRAARPAQTAEAALPPDAGRPVLAPGIDEAFLPIVGAVGEGEGVVYRPTLLGLATLHYVQAQAGLDRWESVALQAALDQGLRGSPWKRADRLAPEALRLEAEPDGRARFAPLPGSAARARSYPHWTKMLASQLYRDCTLELFRCRALKQVSTPGESEGDFRARLRTTLHERRDLALGKLRKRYATRMERLQARIRRAQQRVEREEAQYEASKRSTVISLGATLLGALFGRKLGSTRNVGRATTAVRGASRAVRERGDIARAEQELGALQRELAELDAELQEELDRVRERQDELALEFEPVVVRPRKSDTTIDRLALVWAPWRILRDGSAEPAWR